jgi:hypothetical protein
MGNRLVKAKVTQRRFFPKPAPRWLTGILPASALLTFILSWFGAFPAATVEAVYARSVYPRISSFAAQLADSISWSWLDLAIPAGILLLAALFRWRALRLGLNVLAALYLVFFWSWGLNYQRQPLASKLPFDSQRADSAGIDIFAKRTATEINRLYLEKGRAPYDEQRVRQEAVYRVRHVVGILDGLEWPATQRVKSSFFVNPWFRVAGVDGLFNPFGQEPLVSNTLLAIERPFVIAHELAHVRGYPNEGEANLIAVFATILSNDPHLQYSGWLNLWLYLRTRELDRLLDPGPQQDLQGIFERARREQIRWISNLQTAVLDWYLKANRVEEGIRSYSQMVVMAAGTEPYWERFR